MLDLDRKPPSSKVPPFDLRSRIAGMLPSALLATLVLPSVAAPQPPVSQAAAPRIALVGATVIDGTGQPPIPDAVVQVQGSRIVSVGPRSSAVIAPGARIIQLEHRWIIPGLIDAHAHFFETGRLWGEPADLDLRTEHPYGDEVRWMKRRVPVTLARYLCAGVTSVISFGGPRFEVQFREAARRTVRAPNVFVAYGPITSAHLGHDVFPTVDGDEATRYVTDVPGMRAAVKRAVSWHADLIKAIYFGDAFAPEETHYFELLPALVESAHRAGMPVAIHVLDLANAKRAILAGVDTLAHPVADQLVDQEFLSLAKSHAVTVESTLALWDRDLPARLGQVALLPVEARCGDPEVIDTWGQTKDLPAVTPQQREASARDRATVIQNVRLMHEYGIPLAVGVDAGNLGLLHGASMHRELELLSEAGLSPMEILVAATRNSAHIARQEANLGTLAPGKMADLLVLTADPLEKVSNFSAIEQVMKGGVLISEGALLP